MIEAPMSEVPKARGLLKCWEGVCDFKIHAVNVGAF